MFPARFVPLQLLPSQYLLPDASCASDLHLCIFAQGGSRTLSLLQLRSIALALSMWACVVRALLVCHGRTLTLGRRYVVLRVVWRFCVFIRMLACDMHTQGAPRMECFSTVFAACTFELTLLRGGRRGTSDMALMVATAFLRKEALAMRALGVLRRFPHLLSTAVSCLA